MTRLSIILTLVLLPAAYAFDLADALSASASRPDAVTARFELLTSQNELARTEGDPLALRTDRVQARQTVELNRAEFEKATFDAAVEIAGAYTGVLAAHAQVTLAEDSLAMAEDSLEIANIRFENGSATRLDVQEAEVSLEEARQNLVSAEKGLGVSLANLEGMVGRDLAAEELTPVPDAFLLEVPSVEDVQAAIETHPDLLRTQHGLELARLSVDTLDPRYASGSQIESAQTQLDTSQALIPEVRRSFDLQARNLVIQAENAADAYEVQRDSIANARERFGVQQERFDAGVISRVQLDQFALELARAELETLRARNEYVTSLLDLQAGALAPLGEPIAGTLDLPDPAASTPGDEADPADGE